MSPWSTSRGTPSLGSSPCPRPRPSTARSITGSGGASRPCSPTSSPGASVWRTAGSGTRTAWRACSWSRRWRCTGRCPPACGRPRVSPCRPKKSPGATGAEGGPRPNLPLQARPAPHPAPASAPDPAATPLGRLAELIGDKDRPDRAAVRRYEAWYAGRPAGEGRAVAVYAVVRTYRHLRDFGRIVRSVEDGVVLILREVSGFRYHASRFGESVVVSLTLFGYGKAAQAGPHGCGR